MHLNAERQVVKVGTNNECSLEEHEQRLLRVLHRLKQYGLKLSPEKCKFFQTSVRYLGHIVSEEGVKTDPDKLQALKSWPVPKTLKELRSFLGFAGYYRRFIKSYAAIAKPLNDLTRGYAPTSKNRAKPSPDKSYDVKQPFGERCMVSVACQYRVSIVSVSCQYRVSSVMVSVARQYGVSMVSVSCQYRVSIVSVWCLYGVSMVSVARQYGVSMVSVACQQRVSIVSAACQYRVSIVSVSCQYRVSIVSVSCQYRVSIVSVSCQYRVSMVSVSCQYRVSIVSVSCQYRVSIVSVSCQYRGFASTFTDKTASDSPDALQLLKTPETEQKEPSAVQASVMRAAPVPGSPGLPALHCCRFIIAQKDVWNHRASFSRSGPQRLSPAPSSPSGPQQPQQPQRPPAASPQVTLHTRRHRQFGKSHLTCVGS
uniref:ribonuclease H n=1 Tax=Knipowitschia caucasica TaxID=637954 RepID=A0AAV2M951_KNICA